MTTVKSILIAPACDPVIIEHPNTYEARKALVGGMIEFVPLGGNMSFLINEEGLLIGLPPNLKLDGTILAGNVYAIREDAEGQQVDVRDLDLITLRHFLRNPKKGVRRYHAEYDIAPPLVLAAEDGEDFAALMQRAEATPREQTRFTGIIEC